MDNQKDIPFLCKRLKELREKTGAGMLDCKKALEANNGNMEASIDWLREKGISKAAKKADRIAAEGLAEIKIDGNTAAIVEVNSETDFVAKNPEFKELVDQILNTVLTSNAQDVEGVLSENGLNDLLVAKIPKIGEKLSFRRFAKVEKTDSGTNLIQKSLVTIPSAVQGVTFAKGKLILSRAFVGTYKISSSLYLILI